MVFEAILGGRGASFRRGAFIRGERLTQSLHLREGVYWIQAFYLRVGFYWIIYGILRIPSKPYSVHSVHSAIGSRMNEMLFGVHSENGIAPKRTRIPSTPSSPIPE